MQAGHRNKFAYHLYKKACADHRAEKHITRKYPKTTTKKKNKQKQRLIQK